MNLLRAFVVCVTALWAAPLSAQPTAADSTYDPGDVETVSGEVVQIEKVGHPRSSRWVYLVLKTDTGVEIPVALGPQWVVERRALWIHAGAHIDVTGWQIVRGKPALLAAEVAKEGAILRLRDRYGVPVWSRRDAARRER